MQSAPKPTSAARLQRISLKLRPLRDSRLRLRNRHPAGRMPRALPRRPATPPVAAAPDDDFIEFLGGDDVGDPALWAIFEEVGAA